MSRRSATCARCLLLIALAGCSELPEIEPGVCGNAVLEPGEDCDGFASHALACRAPGSVGECHMDCSPAPDGTRVRCPAGWGCDRDDVCRKISGAYRALPERVLGNAWSLAAADFDGDGRDDVIAAAQPGALGVTKFRMHRFGRDGSTAQSWTSGTLITTPTPFRLSDAPRSGVAFTRGGSLGVLSGEADGNLLTVPIPSYFLPRTEARIMSVLDQPVGDSAALLTVASRDGVPGLYRQSRTNEHIELAARLPAEVDQLAAEPVAAYLHADRKRYPCRDVVLAYRDAHELSIYAPCEINPFSGTIDWLDAPEITTLSLAPGDSISSGLLAADFDGDGHLDLMVGAESGPYVAYGDGDGFGALRPYAIPVSQGLQLIASQPSATPMPIAAGDLSGDGIADLLLPSAIVLADAAGGPRELVYVEAFGVPGTRWSEALIADFNRDGHADAVAASAQNVDIDFFNGTGARSLNPYTITTDRPVEHLAVGDFDGDFFNDLAFVQRSASPDALEEVSIAYGDASGAPSTLVTVARVQDVQQISPFSTDAVNAATHIALFYTLDGDDGQRGSAIALFSASTDRNLTCGVEFSTFSEDSALSSTHALAITVGSFLQPERTDVVGLALGASPDGTLRDELWLLPDLAAQHSNSLRLGWDFAGTMPLYPRDETTLDLSATLAAGDLDGDGIDELLFSTPDDSGGRCVLASARVVPAEASRVQRIAALTHDEPCRRAAALSVADLDGDGDNDVLWLLGADDARALWVLWGDDTGALDAERAERLTPEGASVQAFTTFRRQPDAPLELAYTTENEARLLHAGKAARRFDDAGQLIALDRGAGITVGDVDGDGVTDLVVVDGGALRVLHAELERARTSERGKEPVTP